MSWAQETQDRWFYYVLAVSTVTVFALFWPYLDVLVFATVTASVAWPMQAWTEAQLERSPALCRALSYVGGTSLWSALGVSLVLLVALLLPISLVLLRFLSEAIHLVDRAAEWVSSGRLETLLAELRLMVDPDQLPEWVSTALPKDFDPIEAVEGPLRSSLAGGLGALSNTLPSVLAGLVSGVIDVILYLLAVVTMLANGPAIMKFMYRLSPMDDDYERRLASVFREFSVNMVVGSFATALAQGIVASLGFWWAGVPRPVFFGVLTAIASFVPVVGTAVVVTPVVVWTWSTFGLSTGVGLLVWSVVVIGTVDNLLRPLFMRGSSSIHPLLIFLAVFGGMSWMGVTGVLIGPVLVAFFLALTRIRDEEFGGHPSRFPSG